MSEGVEYINKLVIPALGETLYMVSMSIIFSTLIGAIISMIMVVTNPTVGLKPNRKIYMLLDTIVNIIRSFPFLILLVSIIPFTRFVVGTSIGTNAAIVPLTITASPFLARLFESSLLSINSAVIEAAQSFGATTLQILFKVMMVEAVPLLVSNITMSVISLLGASAAAGAVGAGGLGSVALTYGYQNFNDTIMYSTVVVLIVIVQLIQYLGTKIYNHVK
ncbi:methionine ABC transporter permease [Facklamia hominis]|uniref:ABC transmembrane type-1 domain-containing protein n=1 Tax=Facklamia hominis CCUG 36813 TaxID=883111 RepID=K1LBH7_9LACT|nr:methionine ABC transporter permease [Facklamia hominis]EKB53960.1 hypothetical protein HMPREF9706_01396 [Facklamia hominis CCUG 36813]